MGNVLLMSGVDGTRKIAERGGGGEGTSWTQDAGRGRRRALTVKAKQHEDKQGYQLHDRHNEWGGGRRSDDERAPTQQAHVAAMDLVQERACIERGDRGLAWKGV